MVQYGNDWLDETSPAQPASARVPTWARVVRAFVDRNGDGRIQRFDEPAAHCALDGARWRCPLSFARVVAHRVVSARLDVALQDELADNVTVLVEAFDTNGAPVPAARACLRDEPTLCSSADSNTLGPSGNAAIAIAPCPLTMALTKDIPIDLTVDDVDMPRNVTLEYPRRLDATVSMTSNGGAFLVTATPTHAVTHAILWIGDLDARDVSWSSERVAGALHRDGNRLMFEVPVSELESCGGCKMLLQLAEIEEGSATSGYSELRVVLDPSQPS